MRESIFEISKMDCPSEENLIRMRLDEFSGIRYLEFDIPARQLSVFHDGTVAAIESALQELNLGSQLLSSNHTDDIPKQDNAQQRSLLWAVLAINFAFFLIEITTGVISGSMGLVADSLDMLADSLVYGISLLAVGSSVIRKKRTARIAGYLQMGLAILGFLEVLRRFIVTEGLPDFSTMIVISVLALIANAICLVLLQKSRDKQEAHMKASMIFTSNDIIINAGVIIAGLLVNWLNSNKPDLLIGIIVFVLVIQGAFRILKLGK